MDVSPGRFDWPRGSARPATTFLFQRLARAADGRGRVPDQQQVAQRADAQVDAGRQDRIDDLGGGRGVEGAAVGPRGRGR